MGKYDGLSAFLRRWKLRNDADGVELTFSHIERLIGGYLPDGAADGMVVRDRACGSHCTTSPGMVGGGF